jgi:hypothetical protein
MVHGCGAALWAQVHEAIVVPAPTHRIPPAHTPPQQGVEPSFHNKAQIPSKSEVLLHDTIIDSHYLMF